MVTDWVLKGGDFLSFFLCGLCTANGMEEFLQWDQGAEGEGTAQPCEANAFPKLCEECSTERAGQLPCQVHPNQLRWPSLACLLWWDDLLLPGCTPWGTPSPWAPAACQGARPRRPLMINLSVVAGVCSNE